VVPEDKELFEGDLFINVQLLVGGFNIGPVSVQDIEQRGKKEVVHGLVDQLGIVIIKQGMMQESLKGT
jgi:hypothetical protein